MFRALHDAFVVVVEVPVVVAAAADANAHRLLVEFLRLWRRRRLKVGRIRRVETGADEGGLGVEAVERGLRAPLPPQVTAVEAGGEVAEDESALRLAIGRRRLLLLLQVPGLLLLLLLPGLLLVLPVLLLLLLL